MSRLRALMIVTPVLLFGALPVEAQTDPGLVAHWPLEPSFSNVGEPRAYDESVTFPLAPHAPLVGFGFERSPWERGVLGRGVVFDGIDDHVSLCTDPLQTIDCLSSVELPVDEGTLGHWLRPDRVGSHGVAAYWSSCVDADGAGGCDGSADYNGLGSSGDALEIHSGASSAFYFYYQDGTGSSNQPGSGRWTVSGGTPAEGRFTHLAVTWDRSGDLVLYVDCVEVDRQPMSQGSWSNHVQSQRFFARPSEGNRYWKGGIDDVKLFDRALGGEEIADLFCPRRTALPASVTAPVVQTSALFGIEVAMDQDVLVAAATGETAGSFQAGAVYFFTREAGGGGAWTVTAKRVGPGGSARLGVEVDVSGSTALAVTRDGVLPPAVYVYERHLGELEEWGEAAVLEFPSGTLQAAIDGDLLVVGGSDDSLHPYERDPADATHWTPLDPIPPTGLGFGSLFALDGARLAVLKGGGVSVFERDAQAPGGWSPPEEIADPSPRTPGAIALAGDTLVLGVAREEDDRGAVYVFEWAGPAGPWELVERLVAPDGDRADAFGQAIAFLRPDRFVVAAPDEGTDHGGVYLASRQPGGGWKLTDLLTAAAFEPLEVPPRFGQSVAASDGWLAIGAPAADQESLVDVGRVFLSRDPEVFVDGFESGDASRWSFAPPLATSAAGGW